jgi:hypothetical protein
MDWWGAAGVPQAGPPCSRPAQTEGPQHGGQSMGVTSIGREEVRQALGEDPTPTGPIVAAKFPHGQLHTDGPRPPGQVREAARIAAMHGRGWHGTAWAGRSRRCRRELEPHRLILNMNRHEADPMGGWESCTDQCMKFSGHHPICYRAMPRRCCRSPKLTISQEVVAMYGLLRPSRGVVAVVGRPEEHGHGRQTRASARSQLRHG